MHWDLSILPFLPTYLPASLPPSLSPISFSLFLSLTFSLCPSLSLPLSLSLINHSLKGTAVNAPCLLVSVLAPGWGSQPLPKASWLYVLMQAETKQGWSGGCFCRAFFCPRDKQKQNLLRFSVEFGEFCIPPYTQHLQSLCLVHSSSADGWQAGKRRTRWVPKVTSVLPLCPVLSYISFSNHVCPFLSMCVLLPKSVTSSTSFTFQSFPVGRLILPSLDPSRLHTLNSCYSSSPEAITLGPDWPCSSIWKNTWWWVPITITFHHDPQSEYYFHFRDEHTERSPNSPKSACFKTTFGLFVKNFPYQV